MSDTDRIHRPGKEKAQEAPDVTDAQTLPRERGLFGATRMAAVNGERNEAAASLRNRLAVMRKADGKASPAAIPESGGGPLPGGVRSKMEPRLGADLSSVRMHTSGESAEAATSLGARAFTVGQDVHFNAGEFAPGTREGDKLIAHELTHVVQGQRSGIQRKAEHDDAQAAAGEAEVSHPDEPAEKEADAVAENVSDDLHGGKDKSENQKSQSGHAKNADKADVPGDSHPEPSSRQGAQSGAADTQIAGASAAVASEKPATISAKYVGIGRKIYRVPTGPGGAAAPAGSAFPSPPTGDTTKGVLPAPTPSDTLTSEQYKTFKMRFAALQTSMNMPVDEGAAQKIWLQVVATLQSTDPAYKAAPAAPTAPTRKDLTSDAFQKIMKDFEPITAALRPYMEKWAKGKKSWAFWSGKGAMDVAKKNSEVCLEKSALGGLFDGININGAWDTQLWAALSRAYATEAAKNVTQKEFRGFVGQGSSAEASIFNKVEQPQFVSMLDQKQQAALKMTWYAVAVDPKDPGKSKHDPTCVQGGMEGVMASGPDRGAMVAMAESMNEKRQKLFAQTGQVVAPDKVDATLSAASTTSSSSTAEGSNKATAGSSRDGTGGTGTQTGGDPTAGAGPSKAPKKS